MPLMHKENSEENTLIACNHIHAKTQSTNIGNITPDGNSWLLSSAENMYTSAEKLWGEQRWTYHLYEAEKIVA